MKTLFSGVSGTSGELVVSKIAEHNQDANRCPNRYDMSI